MSSEDASNFDSSITIGAANIMPFDDARDWIYRRIDDVVTRLPREQQEEWKELHQRDWRHGCQFIAEWTPEIKDGIHAALHDAAMEIANGEKILEHVSIWEPILGAWLACQMARRTLGNVPLHETAPRAAVEASELCILGRREVDGLEKLSKRALETSHIRKAMGDRYAPAASVAHYACNATISALSYPYDRYSNYYPTLGWAMKTVNATNNRSVLPEFLAKELRRGLDAVEECLVRRPRIPLPPFFNKPTNEAELSEEEDPDYED